MSGGSSVESLVECEQVRTALLTVLYSRFFENQRMAAKKSIKLPEFY